MNFGPLYGNIHWLTIVEEINKRFQYYRRLTEIIRRIHYLDNQIPVVKDENWEILLHALESNDLTSAKQACKNIKFAWLKRKFLKGKAKK